jgi:phage-related protein
MEENRVQNVYYYVDTRGKKPVIEFIEALSSHDQAKVLAYIGELKKQGHNLRRPMADYLGNDIYELRPKDNRIFYFFYLKGNVILVHAIKKKTKQILPVDLALCLRRKQEIESEYGHHLEKLEL